MRFVVTELEGFLTSGGVRPDGSRRPGISVQVLDTAWNYRVVASWRSEESGGQERVRRLARRRCDELNGAPPVTRGRGRSLATHCPQGHPRTPENTYRNPSHGGRVECLVCKREAQRRYDATRSGAR